MNVYKLSKDELKNIDKEFRKTEYGKFISIVTAFQILISFVTMILSLVIVLGSLTSNSNDFPMFGLTSLLGTFIIYSISIICYLIRMRELRKYVESKKKK